MSQASALAEARELKVAMSDYGVKCSIELQIGRTWSGDDWYSSKFLRMHHHTVSRPSSGKTPCLYICKHGRPDVPGPLCNGYGGYDQIYRIITMGLANHPGLGGPITIDGVTVPKNSARISTWGTEWEGGIETWPEYMLEFMGRADNALADWMGRPVTSQMEHKTWAPDRKIDRLNFDRLKGIALTRVWRGQKGDADDMSAADVKAINDNTNKKIADLKTELVKEMELRDSVAPFRVVAKGYESGAEGLKGKVFHTDFCGYIQEVVNGQGLDRLIIDTMRLGAENPTAIRVEEDLLQWMVDEWGSADGG